MLPNSIAYLIGHLWKVSFRLAKRRTPLRSFGFATRCKPIQAALDRSKSLFS